MSGTDVSQVLLVEKLVAVDWDGSGHEVQVQNLNFRVQVWWNSRAWQIAADNDCPFWILLCLGHGLVTYLNCDQNRQARNI